LEGFFAQALTKRSKNVIEFAQSEATMKKDIHPKYEFVVFKDGLTGTMFLSRSTMTSREKVKFTDGKEYPLITLEITSDSHPFFTGTQQLVDTAGRVERFNKRYKVTAPKK
jgi:large subunit ribosomal protein L31